MELVKTASGPFDWELHRWRPPNGGLPAMRSVDPLGALLVLDVPYLAGVLVLGMKVIDLIVSLIPGF